MGAAALAPRLTDLLMAAEEYKRVRTMLVGAGKGNKGLAQNMKGMGKGGMANPHNSQMNAAQMARMLPPQVRADLPCAAASACG